MMKVTCVSAFVLLCGTELAAAAGKKNDVSYQKIMSDADSIGSGGKYDEGLMGRWCWDIQGGASGLVENGKIVIQKCKDGKKSQDFVLDWYSLEPGHGNSESFAISTRIRPDLCVGVREEKEKAWLRLEKCRGDPTDANQSWAMAGDMCAPMIAENAGKAYWEMENDEDDMFFITTQGLSPNGGDPVMLRKSKYYGNSIGWWCVDETTVENEDNNGDEWACSLTDVTSFCETSVAAIESLRPTSAPDHVREAWDKGVPPGKQEDDFDVNVYLDYLNGLSLPDDKVLDYVRYYSWGGSHPILYARSMNEPPFLTAEEFWDTCSNNACPEFIDDIITEDNPRGYMQLAALSVMGDQFDLFWHALYNDDVIVCNEAAMGAIFRQYSVPDYDTGGYPADELHVLDEDELALARTLDLAPTVECDEDQHAVRVKVVMFTKWGGLYRTTFTIGRGLSRPKILKTERETLIPFEVGYVY